MKNVIVLFAFALVTLTGCSKKTAPESFQQAQETQQRVQNIIDSLGAKANVSELFGPVVEEYEQVVRAHPTSPEAEQALFKVAELHAGVLNHPEKAIETFKRYSVAFPSGPKTQTAMFMIGYIYNNNLNMLDSAKAAYMRFLERFPESELATSAQYELNTLGKKPEELLNPEPVPDQSRVAKKTH
jgi:outer membrane protein assembly factor BamD (BamD/ComL family)